jgi:hypothetical protein
VIIAQHVATSRYYKELEKIVADCDSKMTEITLFCEEEDAIQRCVDRGKRSGYKTGYRPGGILESEGGVEKLRSMYQEMVEEIRKRENMICVNSIRGEEDDTYKKLLNCIHD